MTIMLYGATGYTGKLIAKRAKETGVALLLSGRDPEKVRAVAEPLGFEHRAVSLTDPTALDAALKGVSAVLHTAGPFSATSQPMVDACLRNRCHYADITGEIAVFESVARQDARAKASGITLIPGVGFDVVPSDCIAAYVAAKIPGAERLVIAIGGLTSASGGTTKTAIESLGLGTAVRRDGEITMLRRAPRRAFDFGSGSVDCIGVGWGDVATAWRSTHVPSIEVYFQAETVLTVMEFIGGHFSRLAQRPSVQRWLTALVDKGAAGPSEEQRSRTRTQLLAIAEKDGVRASALLETPEAYSLTVHTALDAVQRLAAGEGRPGYFTPASLFGADYVLRFEGVTRKDH